MHWKNTGIFFDCSVVCHQLQCWTHGAFSLPTLGLRIHSLKTCYSRHYGSRPWWLITGTSCIDGDAVLPVLAVLTSLSGYSMLFETLLSILVPPVVLFTLLKSDSCRNFARARSTFTLGPDPRCSFSRCTFSSASAIRSFTAKRVRKEARQATKIAFSS